MRTNRYNTEVYKKRYQTFLTVLFAIPHFRQGIKMINLIDKTKRFSEKKFYDRFLKYQIQAEPLIRTSRGVYLGHFYYATQFKIEALH